MNDLLIRQFRARYESRIENDMTIAARCRNDWFHPRPTAEEWRAALDGWGQGLRLLLIGDPRRWPFGWTVSIPSAETRLVGLDDRLGSVQTIGKQGSRFEHRVFDPSEFTQIATKL